jgi:beta-lactam-binding protein with PASTA domain
MTHTDEEIQDLVRQMYTTAESTDWQLTADEVRGHRVRRRVPLPDMKVMLLAAAAVVLVLVGFGVARSTQSHNTIASGSTTTTSTTTAVTVTVPEVVGTTTANAMATLSSAGLKVTLSYVSNTSAAGTVLAVTPSAGAVVAGGSTVNLTVSRGSSTPGGSTAVRVPNVVGLSQAAAAAALGQAGLNVGSITVVQSTTFPAGDVVNQNPVADSSLSAGASVDLSTSSGP